VDAKKVKIGGPPTPGSSVSGQVLAYIVEESDASALVEVPGEAVIGGLRTWVPKKNL
jgi:hypothetical protein